MGGLSKLVKELSVADLEKLLKDKRKEILRFSNQEIAHIPASEKTLREHISDFYTGELDAYTHFSDILKKGGSKVEGIAYRGNKPQFRLPGFVNLENITNNPNIQHTYRYVYNPESGKTIAQIDAFSGKNLSYAGRKMGAEIALGEYLKTNYPNSVYIPESYTKLFASNNNFNNMASLMAIKKHNGITSSFDDITDNEVKKVFNSGWKIGLWKPDAEKTKLGTFKDPVEMFWEKYKDRIKKLMYLVPMTAGAGIITNEKGDQ